MTKREINQQLFKLIVKILVDCKNYLEVHKLIKYASEQSKLEFDYVKEYVRIMISKDLLHISDDLDISLTKEACDKYRELRDTEEDAERAHNIANEQIKENPVGTRSISGM